MRILWTLTDESPRLASQTLLPIVEAFAGVAGIEVVTRDISLASRIIAQFPEWLAEDQRLRDPVSELRTLVAMPDANIIKLPNISASISQIKATITQLQARGYDLPDYPDSPATDVEQEVRVRYDRVKGSAVNPVLRQGNSERRAPLPVKSYAKKHPHRMGRWFTDSKTNVATMAADDFRTNEKTVVIPAADILTIEFVANDGGKQILKSIPAVAGDIFDATVMHVAALREFIATQIQRAKDQDILFSVHLKATMMKVSDPIIFGQVIRVFFHDVFEKYGQDLAAADLNPNDGLDAIFAGLAQLPNGAAIRQAFDTARTAGPGLAMVDPVNGITNLHIPNDVIIDSSMPAMIRAAGHMRGSDGTEHDTLAVIPDSSYAGIYQAMIEDCRVNGAFDPATMGSVPNVGLMALDAEEYGSQDTTFEMPGPGTVRVVDSSGATLLEHDVSQGDIWRACQTKDLAIRDWVKLAIDCACASRTPAVFWLDAARSHDAALIGLVNRFLPEHDVTGLKIEILSPTQAMRFSLERIRRGEDTLSVTGNILRDYLTDLFPIMELGTSAKMLSIVPLLNGGRLFETGAGGTAPLLARSLAETGYFGWDSTGEFLALAESLQFLADSTGNRDAETLRSALTRATESLLDRGYVPIAGSTAVDTRESHQQLAALWLEELAHTPLGDSARRSIPLSLLPVPTSQGASS